MVVIHQATLTPTKLELLADWLPSRPWFAGPEDVTAEALQRVGSFRFDDPHGQVGLEFFLVRAGQLVFHVPLSYRGVALPEADNALIGTTEHTVLGSRWVYDATQDPVAMSVLIDVVCSGRRNEDVFVQAGRDLWVWPEDVRAEGTGSAESIYSPVRVTSALDSTNATVVNTTAGQVVVHRTPAARSLSSLQLIGHWDGQESICLAEFVPS
jgi:hypothetical protein